jgi:deoxyribose-phosphate aldolase
MTKLIKLESYIDHTLLKSGATSADIERLCSEALEYNFKTVCINPGYIELAARLLKNSKVGVGTVCGFPLGATKTEVKVYEAEVSENSGAVEIDMVANIGAIKSADFEKVKADIARVRKSLVGSTVLKVILECSLLADPEIERAAQIAADCGANFVKTSTGFFGGATVHHVSLLFNLVGKRLDIKAAGGIRDVKTMLSMIEAGASRIGTSSAVQIMEEYYGRTGHESS